MWQKISSRGTSAVFDKSKLKHSKRAGDFERSPNVITQSGVISFFFFRQTLPAESGLRTRKTGTSSRNCVCLAYHGDAVLWA